jgi:hypothetical protein
MIYSNLISFVMPVTGLNRPNTGKENDDDRTITKYCTATTAKLICHSKPKSSASEMWSI